MGWFGDPMNTGAGNRQREGKASRATPATNAHWNGKAKKKERKVKRAERRQRKSGGW